MAVKRRIYVWFLVGETVYLYSPKLFGKYEIKEEKVMQVSDNNLGISYTASNGYVFTDKDVGVHAFHYSFQAEEKMKEVLNENTNQT